MPCCLLCFSDDPIEGDNRYGRPNKFQITMTQALTKNQPCCCVSFFCAPCAAMHLRYDALEKNMKDYVCCQGAFDGACCGCWKSGNCCESTCPWPCLCLESFCCLGPSVSSSRIYVMDKFELESDSCDRRVIRFTNCIMCLSIICDIASIFVAELRDFANILRIIADIVFYCTVGCMISQVNEELKYQRDHPKENANYATPTDTYAAPAKPM